MKKLNLKFIPLLALTFMLSNSYTTNIFAINPDIIVKEVAKLNADLWHYRRDSLNTQNLNEILLKINPQENSETVITKVAQTLKDLYQGYFVGYANKTEKLSILRALKNFNDQVPENTIIKALEHKARRSVLSLDDLIKKLLDHKNDHADLLQLSARELLVFMNCRQDDIDFLPALFSLAQRAETTEENQQFLKFKDTFVNKKIAELKDYSWIRRNKIQRFQTIINKIKNKSNSEKKWRTIQAIVDLNLHKVSRQHAQLTYDLLYNILYI